MKYLDFLPDSINEFKVSFSQELLDGALKLYDYCESNSKFEYTHYYRKHIIQHGFNRGGNFTDDIQEIIKEDILKPIDGIGYCESIKLEKIDAPRHEHQFQYKKTSRLASVPAALPTTDEIYGSSCWHIDAGAPLNNMVMLVYLNDVDESTGPFTIAYPTVLMEQGNDTVVTYRDTASIPSVSILGRAGTVVCFHSYLLHRGNVPIFGSRKAILISILPEDPKYVLHLKEKKDII